MADSSERSQKAQGRVSLAPAERRRRRRDWRLALAVGVGLLVLVAVEQQILRLSHGSPIGSDAILLALLHVNVIGTAVLVFLIGRNVVKLVIERRRGILGSRLNTKFVVSFVFVAAISTTVLFAFSAVLVSRAVDSWLEIEVGESLGDALAISEGIYGRAQESSLAFARRLALQIEQRRLLREDSLDKLRRFIAKKQLEYGLGSVEVVSARREMLARATHPDVPIVSFERPGSKLIDSALHGLERTALDQAGAGELIRGAVPIHSTFQRGEIVGVVVVNSFVPAAIGRRVAVVRRALESYRRLQPSRGALRTSLVLLLAMVALSILLFASWIGFRLAKQVTGPIQDLALAANQIAAGNLDVQVQVGAHDELGMLMAAFNRMANDLAVSHEDLEQRRAQMEIILRSVAAGVLSIDRDGRVMTINPSALRLLGIKRDQYAGRKLAEVLPVAALETVESMLRRLAAGPHASLRRQAALVSGEQSLILHWTASELRDLDGELFGFVIVLDDVTQISRAQRMSAWRELARRIAHEIKNPLTPIQLAAQRLRRKLGSQLPDEASRELLNRYTDAITSQVEAMRSLLSEFSDYARLPATEPQPSDLNALVTEIVEMYRGNQSIRFRTELDRKLPWLDLDREQIKRVILNLIDNGIAAIEEAGPGPRKIVIATRCDPAPGLVHLEVADSGLGIPSQLRSHLFEPDFSTKGSGSGLGLAIVRRIISDHSGYIRVRDQKPRGTRFIIGLPVRS